MSEFSMQFKVDPAGGEIVGNGVLAVVHIGYPKVRYGIVDVEKIEEVEADPKAFKGLVFFVFVEDGSEIF